MRTNRSKRSAWIIPAVLASVLLVSAPSGVSSCPLHKALLGDETLWPYAPAPSLLKALDRFLTPPSSDGVVTRSAAAVAESAVAVPGKASEVGRWRAPIDLGVIGIHAATFHTGETLLFSYPFFSAGATRARLLGMDGRAPRAVDWRQDLFCAGHSMLPDGKLLVAGGNGPAFGPMQPTGIRDLHTFDPETDRWRRVGAMDTARWYPTVVSLANGDQLVLAGLDDSSQENPTVELIDIDRRGRVAGIRTLAGARRQITTYPRVHLLPSGEVVHVAPEPFTRVLDPRGDGAWRDIGWTRLGLPRFEATSFAVPGNPSEIAICGGLITESRSTASCERLDLGTGAPTWRGFPSLNAPRAHGDAVVLPDGSVLIVGGAQQALYQAPTRNPELWVAGSGRWRMLPAQRHARGYHATAVLLPDATVLSAGQDEGDAGTTAEIYEPAYLFRGPRPVIAEAPESIAFGDRFEIRAASASRIRRASLVGLSAVTHTTNSGQVFARLSVRPLGGDRWRLTAPSAGGHVPPGWYMLFVLDRDGVPSVARMVRLGFPQGGDGGGGSGGGGDGGGGGGDGRCALPPGHPRFCTECGPCGDGAGDCDRDADCAPGLLCAQDVGAEFGFHPGIDVCRRPAGTCPWPRGHGKYCRDCGPCAVGEGDCDNDAECVAGSRCVDDIGARFGFAPAVDVCQPGG